MSAMTEMQYKNSVPVLPLRDVVVFPRIVVSLYVGRAMSLRALDLAMKEGGQVFLVTQKSADTEEPTVEDLHEIGCLANVLQMLRLPDDTMKILVEGTSRCKGEFSINSEEPISAITTPLPMGERPGDEESTAMCRSLQDVINRYAKANRKIGEDLLAKTQKTEDLLRLTDILASNFPMPIEKRQEFLELSDYRERTEKLISHIQRETSLQKIERKIRGRVKNQVEKNHREYYLQEQMRAIQKEMGGEDHNDDLEDFKKRIKAAGMPEAARKKSEQELKKLRQMAPMSAEASVTRSYLETLLSVPWKQRSKINSDTKAARKVLDTDHFGLEKIKERILEYLAVQKRVANGKAPILCFVGPPGVGKTSLGRSIATATGRKYIRISLGGVRDEAEIRGHRRTYIGAMPGKIINAMIRAEVKNPVILLDEIDKMGFDFRGDPAAALLEVLDPEQNNTFSDHYVDVDYDLSEVMFVTTANTMHIPPALQDRLEIIRLSGYTEDEKVRIASDHLIPRQFKENGLREEEADFRPAALRDIIRYYTQEAGVRTLERTIGRVCRKLVLYYDRNEKKKGDVVKKSIITPRTLKSHLGVRQFHHGLANSESKIGQVNGLAWTEFGGEMLSVEACAFPGKGKISRTGKLGEVMRESVEAAFSVVRTRASEFNAPSDFTKNKDFHIHFPEGAIPKDGPSAGIAIATAVLSVASNIPVRADVAMTGEITLRGEVLPIGGIKEKLLAASRAGIRHVILPKENERHMEDIPANIKNKFRISFVKWIDEVFNLALAEIPKKKTERKRRAAPSSKAATKPEKPADDKTETLLPH